MRDYELEIKCRVDFIKKLMAESGVGGIVFGNSGGKDAALVGILCKLACDNTLGLVLPCGSNQNYGSDMDDAIAVANQFGFETRLVDLKGSFEAMKHSLADATELTDAAVSNIAPRLRMAVLYAVAASEGRLVAGTSNRSERYMGYFTKWGDGACDFNPIADLTVSEIYEFLEYLGAPRSIIEKAPSAGLFDGQTDEIEMGVSYKSIDGLLLSGTCADADMEIIERFHKGSEHKRKMPVMYGD